MKNIVFLTVAIFVLRVVDVFIIRSDEWLGEQVLTKVLGLVLVVWFAMEYFNGLKSIGFGKDRANPAFLLGFLITAIALSIGYFMEYLYLNSSFEQVVFYVEAQGNTLIPEEYATGGLAFASVLITGNVINSLMEEGLFRGVLLFHLSQKMSFWKANFIQAGLFGVWHIVWGLRDWMDGNMDFTTMAVMSIGYVVLSGLIGLIWGMLVNITGSLWSSFSAHTLNNTVLNMAHFTTASGIQNTIGLRVVVTTLCVGLLVYLWSRISQKRVE